MCVCSSAVAHKEKERSKQTADLSSLSLSLPSSSRSFCRLFSVATQKHKSLPLFYFCPSCPFVSPSLCFSFFLLSSFRRKTTSNLCPFTIGLFGLSPLCDIVSFFLCYPSSAPFSVLNFPSSINFTRPLFSFLSAFSSYFYPFLSLLSYSSIFYLFVSSLCLLSSPCLFFHCSPLFLSPHSFFSSFLSNPLSSNLVPSSPPSLEPLQIEFDFTQSKQQKRR